jgi:hypothetical protein
MNKLTPLTSRSGESEWPYKKKTVIAIPDISCDRCVAYNDNRGNPVTNCHLLPDCTETFKDWVSYIEKPATK